MSTTFDPIAARRGFENKTSHQLLNILAYSQDDYNVNVIPIIENVLIDRGIHLSEIEAQKLNYYNLKKNIDSQPKTDKFYKSASFFPRFLNYFIDHFICTLTIGFLWEGTKNSGLDGGSMSAAAIVVYLLYYTITIGSMEATIGMKMVNLKVINRDRKKPVDYSNGLVRGVGIVLTFMTLQIGHLIMVANDNKRTLTDNLSKTDVVKA